MFGSKQNFATLPALTVVIGGARSGKSRFAEGLLRETGLPKHYVATAEAWDDEMRTRIAQHRTDRGADWITHDAPLDLVGTLKQVPVDAGVLIDCATLWLSNHLLAEHDLKPQEDALIIALRKTARPVVIVTNEVGLSVVPDNALARRFRDAQGRLNQALAAEAGLVVAVWAGLPLVLKGALPAPALR